MENAEEQSKVLKIRATRQLFTKGSKKTLVLLIIGAVILFGGPVIYGFLVSMDLPLEDLFSEKAGYIFPLILGVPIIFLLGLKLLVSRDQPTHYDLEARFYSDHFSLSWTPPSQTPITRSMPYQKVRKIFVKENYVALNPVISGLTTGPFLYFENQNEQEQFLIQILKSAPRAQITDIEWDRRVRSQL